MDEPNHFQSPKARLASPDDETHSGKIGVRTGMRTALYPSLAIALYTLWDGGAFYALSDGMPWTMVLWSEILCGLPLAIAIVASGYLWGSRPAANWLSTLVLALFLGALWTIIFLFAVEWRYIAAGEWKQMLNLRLDHVMVTWAIASMISILLGLIIRWRIQWAEIR